MPPLFLTLDGPDGGGKTTQCRLLADWLREQGHDVIACADPGGTAVGAIIRGLLLDHRHELSVTCEALLFMASRAQLVQEVIRPALAAGKIVVSDRFLLANVVYQGHAGGIDPEQLWQVGQLATGGLEPDLTLVLDVPLTVAARRRQRPADRLEARAAEYQQSVRDGFLREAQRRPERLRVLDASQPVAVVQEQIRREVLRVLAADSRP
ncbi:MAG: dTMP kinase [Gemmataceae bacterium]